MMAVYVDNPEIPFRMMKMCHMLADSLCELHAMAEKLGLRREWFQDKSTFPHYDLSKAKRKEAVKLGAVEVGREKLYEVLNFWRANQWQLDPMLR